MGIGSNIRRRRLELQMSQRELARAVGYGSRSAIAKVESGEGELPASRLLAVARALDTSVESLLTDLAPLGDAESDLHLRPGSRNGAVVLAGGRSARSMQSTPNQFVSVLGRPVMSWCLEAYQRHPMVDDIVVACLEGWEPVVEAYAREAGVTKLRSVVRAGASGVRSAALGLGRLEAMGYADDDVVLVQESTRPLVSAEMVSRALLACRGAGSAFTCGHMSDNVQFVRDGDSWRYVDRGLVVDLQSPDALRVDVLGDALSRAGAELLGANSLGQLFDALGLPLNFVVCDEPNMKVVRREDLAVFEALVRSGRGRHRE